MNIKISLLFQLLKCDVKLHIFVLSTVGRTKQHRIQLSELLQFITGFNVFLLFSSFSYLFIGELQLTER